MMLTLLLLSLLALPSTATYRDPLDEAIYQYHGYSPCRTFFNFTGPVGCHTQKGGIVAPLYQAENIQDLAPLPTLPEKQILLTSSAFLSNTFAQAVKAYSPAGWIIIHSADTPYTPFSAATATPWYPSASGLRWENLPFPVVFITNTTSSNQLLQKAKWNLQNQAHDQQNAEVAHLDPYVGKTDMNLTQCQALNKCKPMGGYSVWSTLGPADDRTKVFAVTQLDAIR